MTTRHKRAAGLLSLGLICLLAVSPGLARSRKTPSPPPQSGLKISPIKKNDRQDDSVVLRPAKDLLLKIEGEHKADALAHFVSGLSLEESGETEKALGEYRKVLNVDPGQSELASRVA